jgi:voltage-gated potassium channel
VEHFSLRRFAWALSAFIALECAGTIGFHELTSEGWIASLYRSVVTTTLTGIDAQPPGAGAQLFTIFLLLGGVAIFLYVAGVIVELIARGILEGALAERRRRRMIEKLHGHYIICGYGRVGRRVAAEFRKAGEPYVVLDFHPESIEIARERGELLVEGNATDDQDLEAAGLARARGLVACSDDDADNLYITLSARFARPDLMIVARASDEAAGKKLRVAGADRVVEPYLTAGRVMANLMIKPQVTAFVDVMTDAPRGDDFRFEEIEVTPACSASGRSIGELQVHTRTGAYIVALRKQDGTFDTTPGPGAVLEDGDVVVAVGTSNETRALEELFAPREAVAG